MHFMRGLRFCVPTARAVVRRESERSTPNGRDLVCVVEVVVVVVVAATPNYLLPQAGFPESGEVPVFGSCLLSAALVGVSFAPFTQVIGASLFVAPPP